MQNKTVAAATNNVGDVAAKEEVWEVVAEVRGAYAQPPARMQACRGRAVEGRL
jgi:hypothetical protein